VPEHSSFTSPSILTMVMFGGMGTRFGPVWGAIPAHAAAELQARTSEICASSSCVAPALTVVDAVRRAGWRGRAAISHQAHWRRAMTLFSDRSCTRAAAGWCRRDVIVEIPEGAVFAIIGPKGDGKSGRDESHSGVYQPESGIVNFGGTEPRTGCPPHRACGSVIARTFRKSGVQAIIRARKSSRWLVHIITTSTPWQLSSARAGRVSARPARVAERHWELLA